MLPNVTPPWWVTSLIITAIVVTLAAGAALASWPWNGLAGLGAVVFLWLALRDPKLALRRAALLCINAGVLMASLPHLNGIFTFDLGYLHGLLEFGDGIGTSISLLGTGVLLAVIDVWRERGNPSAESSTAAPSGAGLSTQELASYRAAVRKRHGFNHFLGFSTPVELAASWEDLYVELVMEGGAGREGLPTFDDFAPGSASQPDLRRAFDYARACNKQAMVLLGHPGSGKTTQLQQILLRVLDEREGPQTLGLPKDALAVLVPLRSLRPLDGLSSQPPLLELLERALIEDLPTISEGIARRLLASPHLILLLDGLDEIPDAMERAKVARVIEHAQRHGAAGHYLLVSSRYAGYVGEANLGKEFLELRLRSLDDRQLERMVTRWYRFVEATEAKIRRRWLLAHWTSWLRARKPARALLRELRGPEFRNETRLYELSRTPLLLTALCLIHRHRSNDGGLPTDRGELYDECERILLAHWREEAKGLPTTFAPPLARRVLEPVAHWLHDEVERRYATSNELLEVIEVGLRDVKYEGIEAYGFLRSFTNESGLLTKHGPELYGFIHLGFQEHLAALYVRERWQREPELLRRLAKHFDTAWWKEVILLMLGPGEDVLFEAFMREVVQQPGIVQWAEAESMQLLLSRLPRASAIPFVEVLKEAAGPGVMERQLAVARVLIERMPRAVNEEVEGLLREHSATEVRSWWIERTRQRARIGAQKVIKAKRGGLELVLIPGGTFLMGSAAEDKQAWQEEKPRHVVELMSFYLARTPVTNAQYREFLKANPEVREPSYWGDRQFNQDKQPVVGVSWQEAQTYCKWAGLVLPSEAQWEYACRAGTMTRYWSGDSKTDLARVGWYRDNSGGRTHPVAEKEANAWGLYDMHGNVWEWCLDATGASYASRVRPDNGLRRSPESSTTRVIRGGCWFDGASAARSANREGAPQDYRIRDIGFRPAQVMS